MPYKQQIKDVFGDFPGLIDRIDTLNSQLRELHKKGLGKLADNLLSNRSSYTPIPFIFELFVGNWLLGNSSFRNVEYEPAGLNSPPDFRFNISSATFQLALKTITQVSNEYTKKKITRRINDLISHKTKNIISIWLSEEIEPKQINDTVEWFAQRAVVLYPGEKEQLVTDDEILASVEVVDQSPKAGGIGVEHIGGTAEGLLAPLNVEGVRDRLRKTVSKAYKSLRYEDVKTFNFLFLASDAYVFDVRLETLAEAIYGTERITHYPTVDETKVVASLKPNGIWSENVYSKLDAIFYFKPNTDWLGADFDPIIFPNPVKIEKLRTVPQPFNSMKCSLPKLVFGPKEL